MKTIEIWAAARRRWVLAAAGANEGAAVAWVSNVRWVLAAAEANEGAAVAWVSNVRWVLAAAGVNEGAAVAWGSNGWWVLPTAGAIWRSEGGTIAWWSSGGMKGGTEVPRRLKSAPRGGRIHPAPGFSPALVWGSV
jgi:hypothetical protein